MDRKKGLIGALLLLASALSLADVEAAEGGLISSAILPDKLPGMAPYDLPVMRSDRQLTSLNDAILLYESIQYSGRWRSFAQGPLLRLGDRHIQIATLRGQLSLLGDLPPQSVYQLASRYFDEELSEALKRFQARHSVQADGVLGPQTRRLLNVPPWQRIDQLVLNMHRQDQLQRGEETYLHVNLPEYRLRLYQAGEVRLDMRTVVGKKDRQTPVFSATVNQLVVNPGWNVPKSIAFKDILPKLQSDPDFLEKRNLRVLTGWKLPRVEVGKDEIDLNRMYQGADYYRFWEPPGENNTLGKLKFQLSTNNSIYLHDTRQKYLFDSQQRAFSSGCIRLEDPRGLADALIATSNQWEPDILDPLFEQQETIKIRLANPVPVHVTYWTAWLDESGVLNFANDLYQRDSVDFAELQQIHQQVGMLPN